MSEKCPFCDKNRKKSKLYGTLFLTCGDYACQYKHSRLTMKKYLKNLSPQKKAALRKKEKKRLKEAYKRRKSCLKKEN